MLEYFSIIIENPSVEQECCSTEILFLKNRASQDVLFSPRWAKRLTWSWTRCSRLWSEFRWSTCSVGYTIASKNIYWQEAAGQTTEISPSFDPQLCLPGHLSHLLTSRIVRMVETAPKIEQIPDFQTAANAKDVTIQEQSFLSWPNYHHLYE